MEKYASSVHPRQDSRGVRGTKSDMPDHPDKKHKQGKSSNSRSQQARQHHQSRRHHQSDESLSQDFHSAEENVVSDHQQKLRHLKQKGLEDGDDTVPLIKGHQSKNYAKQRRKSKSSQSGLTKGSSKNRRASRQSLGRDGSFRKTKSMDNLTTPRDKEENESKDENEQERNMCEVRKNVMKEKMKFSAFLNEITRQVLSPMRLTTLGVTDAQRPSSPGQISNKSREVDASSDKLCQQRSRPANTVHTVVIINLTIKTAANQTISIAIEITSDTTRSTVKLTITVMIMTIKKFIMFMVSTMVIVEYINIKVITPE
ncbi:hypothetical protein OJAV_G00137150 [Oryzias javanicus]|uniref:Uncharacterized protein n=1 Tax=Oryzias javanicus TaxID=123683 RepID=A0A437CL62_ORYJA|nr:hypothetical protein OJAV_G00137150 [Oryzias javanicus]